ncbi:sulfatase/phosphatase domain-containing protein [Draconibacterium sp. IB214405]|uniref:sulfatase/phosphatase domain-containing protein n=1 Tax=Draconibacterium sp. IB214405 TaxID=3097352 RepID=UPI003FA48CE0
MLKHFRLCWRNEIRQRYKLIHFYDNIDVWEIYDLEIALQEKHDRYCDPGHTETIAKLQKRLREHKKSMRLHKRSLKEL